MSSEHIQHIRVPLPSSRQIGLTTRALEVTRGQGVTTRELDPQTGLFSSGGVRKPRKNTIIVGLPPKAVPQSSAQSPKPVATTTASSQNVDLLSSSLAEAQIELDPYDFSQDGATQSTSVSQSKENTAEISEDIARSEESAEPTESTTQPSDVTQSVEDMTQSGDSGAQPVDVGQSTDSTAQSTDDVAVVDAVETAVVAESVENKSITQSVEETAVTETTEDVSVIQNQEADADSEVETEEGLKKDNSEAQGSTELSHGSEGTTVYLKYYTLSMI